MNANSRQADQDSAGSPSTPRGTRAYRFHPIMTSRFRFHTSFTAALLLTATLALAGAVRGAEPFEAFLEKHCVRCHGPEKEKGDLRFDQLSRSFTKKTTLGC